MIIFDTNVINRLNPRTPRADVVRALRASGKHRVGITGTVLEELAAHQAKDYMELQQKAGGALNALRRKMPWQSAAVFEEPQLELEECLEYWRSVYSELFEVLPASGEVALKALAREALALPPAKQGSKRAEGARDAAIWFSILDYLRRFPDEEVHFVTDNTTDFGDGVTYRFPMDLDLGDCAARLKRLTTFDDVVTTFTEPVDGASATVEAQRHLGSEAVAAEIGKLALTQRAVVGFPGINSAGGSVEWKGWIGPPHIALLRTENVVGHRIGEQVWYTAEPTWLLFGTAGIGEGRLENVSCTWKIKLLFPVGDGGSGEDLTLLSAPDPTAPDLQDKPTAEAVEALRAKAIKELIASLRGRVGGAGSSDTAQGLRALGPNLSDRNNALLAGVASQALEPLRAALLAQHFDFSALARATEAMLVPLRDLSPTPAQIANLRMPILGLSSALAQIRETTRPRIDIASTLPTYSIAPSLAGSDDWPHEDSTDGAEEEPNEGWGGADDVEGEG